ncbi:MAG: purine-nucleoside phosphorylase [candidate division Zixibacteria bacterium]|nr:purine-nucleoside phosphorylase [candidate division Zixibacteria bacterium]MDH3937847.1 purine-nucleoside phosphorylase [candidate division Zixibacteria bacterium]MDH4032306.1 purine-nucleoside phosphorylase [candidate division Zixibacteria bacterium]
MSNADLKKMINEAVAAITGQVDLQPKIGIILGTGLGSLVDGIEMVGSVEYDQIPHFAVSTVESHAGRLLFGHLKGKPVVCMQGRFHFYEGYTYQQITFPIRVMKALGIETLIVSNACGGLNPNFKAGDIMMIKDHINFFGGNPLIGPNDDELGGRFPDMYEVYSFEYQKIAREVALGQGTHLQEGVYIGLSGPCLETAAEYRMLRIFGGDAVGMSTIPEVIVARHQGTRVLGFSIVTDMGLPDAMHPLKIEEVIAIAGEAEPYLRDIIAGCVERM